MTKKIGVVSLGCPKNLVDTETMLGRLKNENYEITADKSEADIIIINTCGFIESAKQESINTILEMAECKKEKCELLIVTGCLSERYREKLLEEIPEVDACLGTGNYDEIAKVIDRAYSGERPALYGNRDTPEKPGGERVLATGKGYAYLKIAEGCDNCCTYCIIPKLRGRYRSRPMEELASEAERLAAQGIKEIILVAQDTTRYGTDIYRRKTLAELLNRLGKIEGIRWLRLLYCYPEEIDDALIGEIRDNPKVCKYIDIPIQHASDRILKLMGRRGTIGETAAVIAKLREQIPDITVRTTFIVGFPGENAEDFKELEAFVRDEKFDRLGVFTYSKEEDTPAAGMRPQVPKNVKQSRYGRIMALQKRIMEEKSRNRLGMEYEAIVEGVSGDGIFYFGRTCAEAPDIDGTVYFTAPEPLEPGDFVKIRILNIDEYDLIGEVINESAK